MGAHYDIPLCNSLTLRYTISVSEAKAEQRKYKGGFYNVASFFFYIPALKMRVDKTVQFRLTYAFPKKVVQKLKKNERPKPKLPTEGKIAKAAAELLKKHLDNENQQMPLIYEKNLPRTMRTRSYTLNENELFVFWVTHFGEISGYVKSKLSDDELNSTFLKLCLCSELGFFDLSSLCTAHAAELRKACNKLAGQVKVALGKKAGEKTSNTRDKTQVVRYAVEAYLRRNDIDPEPALENLIRASRPAQGIQSRIGQAMEQHCLSIEQYRDLYTKLSESDSIYATPLMLMIFLGLTDEEVCGLNGEDILPITGYVGGYQIRITYIYRKEKSMDMLEEAVGSEEEPGWIRTQSTDEGDYRCIPIPRAIYRRLKKFVSPNTACQALFKNQDNKRLRPDRLTAELKKLLHFQPNQLTYISHGETKTMDLTFRWKSYRISCRHYWQHHCGLTPGEISYLGAIEPPDTASKHYIDYNNATMQYRILKQMEYGLALFANEGIASPEQWEWTEAEKKKTVITSGLNTRLHVQLCIEAPAAITLASNRGVVVKEGIR